MTPQEEQQAMQEYVRKRLLAGGQLNLDLGQQAITQEDRDKLMRQPLAPGVGAASAPQPLQVPGLEVTGDYATGNSLRQVTQPFEPQVMYRKTVPF